MTFKAVRILLFGASVVFVLGCRKDVDSRTSFLPGDQYFIETPAGFPPMEIPEDNAMTKSRVALGRKLFFDPIMSLDSSISCASCHLPEYGFTDPMQVSLGVGGAFGKRNSISLGNVGYQESLLREGALPSLEMQVHVPIQEAHEFASNILVIAERMNGIQDYVEQSEKAYGRIPDPFVITRAIAAFERTLVSGNSDFDKHVNQGQPVLSEAALRGMDLFFSDSLACGSCHGDFLFSDQSFRCNGLYEQYPDSGRIRLTGLEEDRARFKVASLRNIAHTAPYMHDGSLNTLGEVIDHYASGGANHPNKDSLITGFVISDSEKEDLIQFLESLSDQDFLTKTYN